MITIGISQVKGEGTENLKKLLREYGVEFLNG
jgi:hypothetical protein